MNKTNPKKKEKTKSAAVKDTKSSKEFGGWLWLGAILVLTFIVYFPTLNNKFTNWDDTTYLSDNPLIRSLSSDNIKRIFTEIYFGNYQPLHIFSYALEYHFYKLNPTGYHATSVVMHLMATGLVCWFIWLLTENTSIALITALLFGIHPLHVESVAWAAERKDLLYSIFFVAALITYIKYIKQETKIKYLLYTLLFFVLSALSKTMAVSLVPVLFLIDFFLSRKLSVKLVLEKIPFLLIAVCLGLYSVHASSTTGSIGTHVFGLGQRILFANFNLLAYVVKLLLPIQLSSFYPYPPSVFTTIPFYFYIAPCIVASILLLLIYTLKKTKVYLFAAGFFVTAIFLVLQLLPVGPAMIAERYSYVPSIGFFFMIAHVLDVLITKNKRLKTAASIFLVAYGLFLSVSTFKRSDVWQDSITLWSNVIEQFPHCGMALNNLGNVYGKEKGQLDKAMELYNRSVTYDPNFEFAYVNRGIIYCMREQFTLGIEDFSFALKLKPGYYDAKFNRGIAYAKSKQFNKGIADFNELLLLKKDDALIYFNRGIALAQMNKFDEALADFNTANVMAPSNAEVYYHMAIALYNKQQYRESFDAIKKAAELGYNVDAVFSTIKQAAEAR